jgi:hypothetical protein
MDLPKVHEYRTVPLEYRTAADELQNVLWPLVVWHVEPGTKVSRAIIAASELYAQKTGKPALLALVHQIPEGAEEGVEVRGVTLVRQEWVEPGFVLVGRPEHKLLEVTCQKQSA